MELVIDAYRQLVNEEYKDGDKLCDTKNRIILLNPDFKTDVIFNNVFDTIWNLCSVERERRNNNEGMKNVERSPKEYIRFRPPQ